MHISSVSTHAFGLGTVLNALDLLDAFFDVLDDGVLAAEAHAAVIYEGVLLIWSLQVLDLVLAEVFCVVVLGRDYLVYEGELDGEVAGSHA